MSWGEWKSGEIVPREWTAEEKAVVAQRFGYTVAQVEEVLREAVLDELFFNDQYQVMIRRSEEIVHLSIRRIDRSACHDWRDLQRIKNELVGPEHEGVELYPAESRLVDTANQYHLWVLAKAGERLGIGFNDGRHIIDDEALIAGARQRPRGGD